MMRPPMFAVCISNMATAFTRTIFRHVDAVRMFCYMGYIGIYSFFCRGRVNELVHDFLRENHARLSRLYYIIRFLARIYRFTLFIIIFAIIYSYIVNASVSGRGVIHVRLM